MAKESYRGQNARRHKDTTKKLQDLFVVLAILNERLERLEQAYLAMAPETQALLESTSPKGDEKLETLLGPHSPFAPDANSPLRGGLVPETTPVYKKLSEDADQ
jgi:hypothetical protein